jgi:hypothetical protein
MDDGCARGRFQHNESLALSHFAAIPPTVFVMKLKGMPCTRPPFTSFRGSYSSSALCRLISLSSYFPHSSPPLYLLVVSYFFFPSSSGTFLLLLLLLLLLLGVGPPAHSIRIRSLDCQFFRPSRRASVSSQSPSALAATAAATATDARCRFLPSLLLGPLRRLPYSFFRDTTEEKDKFS